MTRISDISPLQLPFKRHCPVNTSASITQLSQPHIWRIYCGNKFKFYPIFYSSKKNVSSSFFEEQFCLFSGFLLNPVPSVNRPDSSHCYCILDAFLMLLYSWVVMQAHSYLQWICEDWILSSSFIVIINVSFHLLDANNSCRYTERDCVRLPERQMFQNSQGSAGGTPLLSLTETLRTITHASTVMGFGQQAVTYARIQSVFSIIWKSMVKKYFCPMLLFKHFGRL